ncbi:MAG: LacI family DNA-binding transcriptional regulator [Tidjanibacter sp.]|nr:LacI family DNA-binding transcriptional regulator [Tidjanibacter sp.]MBR7129631.1 LacI family DNA-binding transcriptional regulator [Tidjanibacter sp.]
MQTKKVTVKDIARLSGLSIGTVDRVMHNRSGVAEESRRKVVEAMESLGYTLNTNASLLANKKHYRICCLLPSFESGDYWELVYNAVASAQRDAEGYNLSIETLTYNQFSREEFIEAVERLKANLPQAVIVAPIYRNDTIELGHYLKEKGVPMVFIDSKVSEADYLAYYGIPMWESGYLAASLLLGDEPPQSIVNFRIERGGGITDNPTLARRHGFTDYVSENLPELRIYNEFLRPHDKEHNFAVMDKFFAAHPDIRHIVTFNSRVHLIADYITARGLKGMSVLGFDILGQNIKAVQEGVVKYLIVQRTQVQLRRGVNALAEWLAFGTIPPLKDNYMPMDILVKENINFYSELYKDN